MLILGQWADRADTEAKIAWVRETFELAATAPERRALHELPGRRRRRLRAAGLRRQLRAARRASSATTTLTTSSASTTTSTPPTEADPVAGDPNVALTAGRQPSVRWAADGAPGETACRLIVGADGRESAVRRQARIPSVRFLDDVGLRCVLGSEQFSAAAPAGPEWASAGGSSWSLARL